MNYVKTTVLASAFATTAAFAATPEVSSVVMAQDDSRLVTITYTLSSAPAVVTLDVETNCVENGVETWASIGGEAVCNAQGDVWKEVAVGARTITWRPDLSWPDHKIGYGGARAIVTAWATDNTPAYMVVDISAAATPNSQRYYPSADFLPGGILGNDAYRKTALVMRKIMAKDVTWWMGSTTLETLRTAAREATHQATLTNNYYIGVFPVTQSQWDLIQTSRLAPSYFNNVAARSMRPVEKVCYNEIRCAANTTSADSAAYWPNPPKSGSFLDILRNRTGLDFDLPSEAQWEFAARAGNGDTAWGNGAAIMNTTQDGNLDAFGRYQYNGGKTGANSNTLPDSSCGAENGTAIVGSYEPNSWGLYDVAGNVWEWCLDWFAEDVSGLGGMVNETVNSEDRHVKRGGSWDSGAENSRPACRSNNKGSERKEFNGLRVVCTAGLR